MPSRPRPEPQRPRSASLKALPPDSPRSTPPRSAGSGDTGNGPSLLPSAHWTVSKAASAAEKPKRPLKNVSLRLPKGASASPTASGRTSGAATPDHFTSALTLGVTAAAIGRPPPLREKLSSTAPATLGRPPPAPGRPAPGAENSRPVADSHRTAGDGKPTAREDRPAAKLPGQRPVASPERLAAARGADDSGLARRSLPLGVGLLDGEGLIFRPAEEVLAVPRPVSRGGIPSSRPSTAGGGDYRPGSASSSRPSTASRARRQADDILAAPPPPRIAWTEGESEVESEVDSGGGNTSVLEIAAQIRRDLLACHLSEEAPEDAVPEDAEQVSSPRWAPKTEDARKSMKDLEQSLAKATERSDDSRQQLAQYLDDLHAKMFVEDPSSSSTAPPEPLVYMPEDFEDLCDLNAQLAVSRRGRPPSKDAEQLQLYQGPSCMEKYFLDNIDKRRRAVQMLEDLATEEPTAKEAGDLDRGLDQIARLDNLMAVREAEANTRLQKAKRELEKFKERLRREEEVEEKEKLEKLRKLKEKGLIRSRTQTGLLAADRAATKDPSAGRASVAGSTRPQSMLGAATSVSSALVAQEQQLSLPEESAQPICWGGWFSSDPSALAVEDAGGPQIAAPPVPATPSTAEALPYAEDPAEPDATTFALTSTTAFLAGLGQEAKPAATSGPPSAEPVKAWALEPVAEDEDEAPALALEDDVYAGEPDDLDALRRIDEQLMKLVPQQEWEAKSISSHPGGGGSTIAGSRGRSVWSKADSVLPRDPVLRDRMEQRDQSTALASIDSKLQDLRTAPAPTKEIEQGALQKLLMEAMQAKQSLDSTSKVLALTQGLGENAEAALGAASKVDLMRSRVLAMLGDSEEGSPEEAGGGMADTGSALVAMSNGAAFDLPEDAPLRQARQLLHRIANHSDEWAAVFGEASSSITQLEKDVVELEAEVATRTVEEDPEGEKLYGAVAALGLQLQELGLEVAAIADRKGMDEDLIERLRRGDFGDAVEAAQEEAAADAEEAEARPAAAGPRRLPMLTSALDEEEDDDDDDLRDALGNISDAEQDDADSDADAASGAFPREAGPRPGAVVGALVEDGPSAALFQALNIELPTGDGLWSDTDLERACRHVDDHYGDTAPPIEEVPYRSAFLDDDVGD